MGDDMAGSRKRDLLVQTKDGKIYLIKGEDLGRPLTGNATGMKILRAALKRIEGQVFGLRAAAYGVDITRPVGENAGITRLDKRIK
jgi:hypothetical protein